MEMENECDRWILNIVKVHFNEPKYSLFSAHMQIYHCFAFMFKIFHYIICIIAKIVI